jgi:serine/threonine protein phosphatase 1
MTYARPAPPSQRGVLISDRDLDERSIVVIGDIHGCAQALRDLLTQVVNTGCQVVFVGDLMDRGNNFRSVLTIVHSMCEEPEKWGISRATCLMGNHERMILDAYAGYDFSLWLQNGGFIEDFQHISDVGLWGWLNGLPLWYEHSRKVLWDDQELNLLVTHGSVTPGVPLSQQNEETLYWGRKIRGYSHEYITVNGHTICQEEEPLEYDTPTGRVIRLDTGSYMTGVVTGVAFREVDT